MQLLGTCPQLVPTDKQSCQQLRVGKHRQRQDLGLRPGEERRGEGDLPWCQGKRV